MRLRAHFVSKFICMLLAGVALSASAKGLERSAQSGGVTALVTPINLSDATSATIDFMVELNTHSFPLTFDMAKIALLSNGKEISEPPVTWSGGKGGHHLSGELSFTAGALRGAKTMMLTLKGAGGGNDLAFEWAGPF